MPPTFFVVRAHAAPERDDRDGASEAFEAAIAHGLLEMPHGPTWTMTLTWAADICAWLEDRPRAAHLRPVGSVRQRYDGQYGPVARGSRPARADPGRPDEAQRRLREAIALCERMDARAFLAVARHDLGTQLQPSAGARRLLDQARTAANELGMPGLTKRAFTTHT